MKISCAEISLNFNEKLKLVNFAENIDFSKSLINKINCIVFHSENKSDCILICLDIIWLSTKITVKLRNYLAHKYETQIDKISFSASHTHGSINTDPEFDFGEYSTSFNNYLEENIKKVVKKAYSKKIYDTYSELLSKKISDLTVNRRKVAPNYFSEFLKGKPGFWAQNFPNKGKHKDNRIILINFRNKTDNKIITILLKFTCHPVTDPLNCLGSDYPGYLKKYLSNYFNEKPMIFFLQGFAGDVRPNLLYKPKTIKDYIIKLILGDKFRKSTKDDSKKFAKNIIEQLSNLLNRNYKKIFINHIKSSNKELEIILENNTKINKKLNITIWNFEKFIICFLSGEILSGYNFKWNNKNKIIGVGYSNGMTCYIPTSNDLKYGGYEVDKSREKFNVKNRISVKFLDNLTNTLNKLIYEFK